MDTLTARFYDSYAAEISDATENRRSAMMAHVATALVPGACVLDVGSGSGRDVAAMLELGLQAWGVEPNAAMRDKAHERFPAVRGRLREGFLPELGRPFADVCPAGFDAVVCSAVLMHITPTELPEALAALAAQLRPPRDGDREATRERPALLVALPEMDAARLASDRDSDGRRFHNHPPDLVAQQLALLGFTLEHAAINDVVLQANGTRWHLLVFRREG